MKTNNMDRSSKSELRKGIIFALLASLLFGASTPLAKVLLEKVQPVLLAGLFYLGSGVGLFIWQMVSRMFKKTAQSEAALQKSDLPWLTGAIFAGGLCGPVLLMIGLSTSAASSTSLLLNLEGVFTAMLAWFVFKENYDRRILFGMLAIAAGGVTLTFGGGTGLTFTIGSLFVVGACFAWGADNNLTRKVSHADPLQVAMLKGLTAGTVNVLLCLLWGLRLPNLQTIAMAAFLGFWSYGVSLALFVLALRHIGAARTGAYFSLAPFVGAALSICLLGEKVTTNFGIAAVLMGLGLWLHLTESHNHEHSHESLEHEHNHIHDEHHQHEHGPLDPPGEPHSHVHKHEEMRHSHPHFPDLHHGHPH